MTIALSGEYDIDPVRAMLVNLADHTEADLLQVWQIVQRSGGRFRIRINAGGRSDFSLSLPLAAAHGLDN
jgi:hypothetical protein